MQSAAAGVIVAIYNIKEESNMLKLVFRTVLFISLTLMHGVAASALTAEQLALLEKSATRICQTVPSEGESYSLDVTGEINAEIGNLLKKLAELDIKGSGDFNTSKYSGLLQKDLASLKEKEIGCKERVYIKLIDTFTESNSNTEEPVAEANLSLPQSDNGWIVDVLVRVPEFDKNGSSWDKKGAPDIALGLKAKGDAKSKTWPSQIVGWGVLATMNCKDTYFCKFRNIKVNNKSVEIAVINVNATNSQVMALGECELEKPCRIGVIDVEFDWSNYYSNKS